MNDEGREGNSAPKTNDKSPQKGFPISLTVDDISYLLDRLVIVGWVLTTPLWLVGYYIATLWISYGLAVLTAVDIVLHFRLYRWSLAWTTLALLGWLGAIQTQAWQVHFRANEQAARETEHHGWLIPANDPTPENACSHKEPPPGGALLVLFGSEAGWTLQTHQSVLRVGNQEIMSLDRQPNGALAITADLFSDQGNLIARIEHNEFNLVQAEYSYHERSPDLSTLTIFDKKNGAEILYIRYLNPTTIRIRGIFHTLRGVLAVTDEYELLGIANGLAMSSCVSAPEDPGVTLFGFWGH